MTAFSIREVDPDDPVHREEILELHDLTFFDPLVRPDLPRGYWWLVYDMGSYASTTKPIAFCGLTLADGTADTGYLKRAGVLKPYRGNNLQRRMITTRERRARRLGLHTMLTDTTDNPPSSNTLIRAGYRIFEPAYRWAFKHSIYWKKDLTK